VLFLFLYLSLTGMAASVVRASVMAMVLLLAEVLMEEQDGITTLSLAALLCLVMHPLWLGNAGFLLSFAAMWGIVVLSPFFGRLLGAWRNALGKGTCTALGATLATMPLLCLYFHHITWLGWVSSPVVVLLAGVAVILCFISLPFAVFVPPVAGWLLQAAAFVMEGLAFAGEWMAGLPLMFRVTGAVLPWAVVLCYAVFCALPYVMRRFGRVWAAAVLALTVLLFSFAAEDSSLWDTELIDDPQLAVVFIDVGQGDAALLQTKDGTTVLIDGGGELHAPGSVGEHVLLPYLKSIGVQRIDVLISSHPDADHSDGLLSVLERMSVGTVLYADHFSGQEEAAPLLEAAYRNGSRVQGVWAGFQCTVAEELTLQVGSPQAGYAYRDANDASLVVRISYGETDFLFTGDAYGETLAQMVEKDSTFADAEVVKLPHHGSTTGYDEAFYRALHPQAVVFSVGRENSYGHPAENVLHYWQEQRETDIFRTDLHGAVTFWTDGKDLAVQTQNGAGTE